MSFLATLSAKDVVAQYVAAFKAVQNYTLGIENTAPPGDGFNYPNWQTAQAALSQAKQAAMNWPNDVAARALAVPSNIANWNPELSALIADLKLQAQPPLTDAKKTEIGIDANSIVQILAQDAGEFSGLVSGLSSLASALLQAHTTIIGCQSTIKNDYINYQGKLGQYTGQLQAEKSKTTWNYGLIAQLENEIQKEQSRINAAIDWDNTTGQVYNLAVEAVPSAQFLLSFWQGIAQGVAQASAVAKKLPKDPAGVLSLNIQQIEQIWSRVQQEMTKITQLLP